MATLYTRQAMGDAYFLLPIAGKDKPIKRERVHCSELFHQLRVALQDSQLTLTGEPDKCRHPDFPPINPDFILHIPGSHEQNTAVVEVGCRAGLAHLVKDLCNLKIVRYRGYTILVLLLFANQNVPWSRRVQAAKVLAVQLRLGDDSAPCAAESKAAEERSATGATKKNRRSPRCVRRWKEKR